MTPDIPASQTNAGIREVPSAALAEAATCCAWLYASSAFGCVEFPAAPDRFWAFQLCGDVARLRDNLCN
jgi:hypothetical protein